MEYRLNTFGILHWKNVCSITEVQTEMREAEHLANTIITGAEETWWLSKPKFEGCF